MPTHVTLRYRSDAREDRVTARPVLDAADFHDREDFATPCSSKPFAIIEIPSETARLP
jgi:hypothetical protein